MSEEKIGLELEVTNKLFLELSQFTTKRTAKELELLKEVERLEHLASYAIAIMSNVDGGDFKQSEEWVGAFKKWQQQFSLQRKSNRLSMLAAHFELNETLSDDNKQKDDNE